ncbi:MAG: protein kinase [Planctomycetota bacterium]
MPKDDTENIENPGGPDEGAGVDDRDDDGLDLGIQAAFGLDPEVDAPTSRSVLLAFRRSGHATKITLRDQQDDQSPVALKRAEQDNDTEWNLARYQVAGEIARGGVGSVVKARDVDLGRDVALKVLLNAHRGNPEMTRRFLEEAQIGGQLEHPGIVPVHEIGLLADERPYFAMKLVRGQTLAELLEARSSVSEDRQRFLGIFDHVCQTLAYAHTRGVIHRDLKPSNIMVGPFGETQVMDWGLAKVLAKGGVADEARTTYNVSPEETIKTARSTNIGSASIAGSVMGTPAYMAPEQARGVVDELDERTDVFGLGAILCEVVSGKPPFVGKNVEEIFEKARKGDLREAKQRIQSSEAPKELAEIIEHCLQPESRERPRNAIVVAKRISEFRESVDRRARELEIRATRARLKLSVALLALTLVVFGGGGFFWVDRQRQDEIATTTQAVNEAMSQASVLRQQAATRADASVWEAAEREARRAMELAAKALPESDLAGEARTFHREIETEAKDRRAVATLESLREERDSDSEDLEYRFREVFSIYGVDFENDSVEVAAEKIKGSKIRVELVLALDQWAITDAYQRRSRESSGDFDRRKYREHHEQRTQFRKIAQAADDDPWRRDLRNAVIERDRDRLAELVEDAQRRELAPSTFEILAREVRHRPWNRRRRSRSRGESSDRRERGHGGDRRDGGEDGGRGGDPRRGTDEGRGGPNGRPPREPSNDGKRGDGKRGDGKRGDGKRGDGKRGDPNEEKLASAASEELVWRRGQELHPQDFWINSGLGSFLRRADRFTEAVPFLRVAVALRPENAYARYQLGAALAEVADVSGGIRELSHAIGLSSDPRHGYFFERLVRVLEEAPAGSIERRDLSALLRTLDKVASSGREYDRAGLAAARAAVQFSSEDPAAAIVTLEESLREHGARPRFFSRGRRSSSVTRSGMLVRYRESVLPNLVSFTSIDAALSASHEGAESPVDVFLRAKIKGDAARRLYIAGCRLQVSGGHAEAAEKFARASELEPEAAEPVLRRVESLRSADQAVRAERLLRAAIESRDDLRQAPPWKLWASISFVDLGRSADDAFVAFPSVPSAGMYGEQLRGALEAFRARGVLRINCGGREWKDESGTWLSDRFYSASTHPVAWKRKGNHRLLSWRMSYSKDRDGGYELPLPRGTYEVRCEFFKTPFRGERSEEGGAREVQIGTSIVPIDGNAVEHKTSVEDGWLRIYYSLRRRDPPIASISVRRVKS